MGNTGTGPEGDFQIEFTGLRTLVADNFIGLSQAVVTGTPVAETLRGTGGDDTLTGFGGKDVLYGGAGADSFVYRAVADSPSGINRDVIMDWDALDRLDLSAIDANSSLAGNQAFALDSAGAGTIDRLVGQGLVKYYQVGGNTYVVANTGTGPEGDLQIQISGLHAITIGDYIL